MAKLAEQAERYDEMVTEMKKVAQMVAEQELSVEERNLLSVAYKNVIGARRASWRIISNIEQKEESKGNSSQVERIKKYRLSVRPSAERRRVTAAPSRAAPTRERVQVEDELEEICLSILDLLDNHLIPSATTGESKVFYLKMKGDYHRYLAEFKTENARKESAEHTLLAYKAAQARPAAAMLTRLCYRALARDRNPHCTRAPTGRSRSTVCAPASPCPGPCQVRALPAAALPDRRDASAPVRYAPRRGW